VLALAPAPPLDSEALDEAALVAVVEAAAEAGQWRASTWLLERRWPERWGRPTARPRTSAPLVAADDDPFRFLDEVAARRREEVWPP
jgi:hypothetical protein